MHCKQTAQISDFDVEKIPTDIVPECIENEWSENSSNGLMNAFDTDDKKPDLAMVPCMSLTTELSSHDNGLVVDDMCSKSMQSSQRCHC